MFNGTLLSSAPDFICVGTGATAAPGGGGGDANDGLILTNYASYDPDAAEFISLDVHSSIPNWGTNGGSNIVIQNEPWWNGVAPVATIYPPTTGDRACGFGAFPFWKGASKSVKQINFRIEYLVSDLFCGNSINHPKFFIFRCANSLDVMSPLGYRPMLFLENMLEGYNIDNTIALAPAIGTVRMYTSTNVVPAVTFAEREASGNNNPGTFATVPCPFYHRATAGADGAGNPILVASEIVCLEIRINVNATADEPNGVVGYRVYRRNGQIFERCCAITWDENYPVGSLFIADIDTFGGGYFNGANAANAGLYTKIGRRISVATNYQPTVGRAWKGPPELFVAA